MFNQFGLVHKDPLVVRLDVVASLGSPEKQHPAKDAGRIVQAIQFIAAVVDLIQGLEDCQW
jgi:hypothetical protein